MWKPGTKTWKGTYAGQEGKFWVDRDLNSGMRTVNFKANTDKSEGYGWWVIAEFETLREAMDEVYYLTEDDDNTCVLL